MTEKLLAVHVNEDATTSKSFCDAYKLFLESGLDKKKSVNNDEISSANLNVPQHVDFSNAVSIDVDNNVTEDLHSNIHKHNFYDEFKLFTSSDVKVSDKGSGNDDILENKSQKNIVAENTRKECVSINKPEGSVDTEQPNFLLDRRSPNSQKTENVSNVLFNKNNGFLNEFIKQYKLENFVPNKKEEKSSQTNFEPLDSLLNKNDELVDFDSLYRFSDNVNERSVNGPNNDVLVISDLSDDDDKDCVVLYSSVKSGDENASLKRIRNDKSPSNTKMYNNNFLDSVKICKSVNNKCIPEVIDLCEDSTEDTERFNQNENPSKKRKCFEAVCEDNSKSLEEIGNRNFVEAVINFKQDLVKIDTVEMDASNETMISDVVYKEDSTIELNDSKKDVLLDIKLLNNCVSDSKKMVVDGCKDDKSSIPDVLNRSTEQELNKKKEHSLLLKQLLLEKKEKEYHLVLKQLLLGKNKLKNNATKFTGLLSSSSVNNLNDKVADLSKIDGNCEIDLKHEVTLSVGETLGGKESETVNNSESSSTVDASPPQQEVRVETVNKGCSSEQTCQQMLNIKNEVVTSECVSSGLVVSQKILDTCKDDENCCPNLKDTSKSSENTVNGMDHPEMCANNVQCDEGSKAPVTSGNEDILNTHFDQIMWNAWEIEIQKQALRKGKKCDCASAYDAAKNQSGANLIKKKNYLQPNYCCVFRNAIFGSVYYLPKVDKSVKKKNPNIDKTK